MQSINGLHDWEKIGIEPVLHPIERKMPRRPKKNKRMAKNEPKNLKPSHSSRKGLLMTYIQFGQHGHNKQSCTNSKQSDRTTRNMTTTLCQDSSGQTSSTPKSQNNKRKAPLDHLGTQESIVGNINKSSLFCFE
ncbi:hypothetical protein J1N35_025763 [Gossypium stocksii]|uniref:Uncharacterized protein n=1 Tax=Gossypium stocksii TaxID=47602 RepID=A0A9D3V7I1_9ROSI|nr:hypothetical protein J1N35_025763 [Gossypium stocksii]